MPKDSMDEGRLTEARLVQFIKAVLGRVVKLVKYWSSSNDSMVLLPLK